MFTFVVIVAIPHMVSAIKNHIFHSFLAFQRFQTPETFARGRGWGSLSLPLAVGLNHITNTNTASIPSQTPTISQSTLMACFPLPIGLIRLSITERRGRVRAQRRMAQLTLLAVVPAFRPSSNPSQRLLLERCLKQPLLPTAFLLHCFVHVTNAHLEMGIAEQLRFTRTHALISFTVAGNNCLGNALLMAFATAWASLRASNCSLKPRH